MSQTVCDLPSQTHLKRGGRNVGRQEGRQEGRKLGRKLGRKEEKQGGGEEGTKQIRGIKSSIGESASRVRGQDQKK
jgi:hypothetical protein